MALTSDGRPTYPAGEARRRAFERDGFTCVAPRLDPFGAGPCYDKLGRPFSGTDYSGFVLEADRVRDEASMGKAPTHEDPTRLVTACPGHHRGVGPNAGRQWCTANRDLERQWLADHFRHATCQSCVL